VDCIGDNLSDEQAKVRYSTPFSSPLSSSHIDCDANLGAYRTVTSLAIAALAEAAAPYGIESFDDILNPLWTGARKQRGKGLAGFLKAVVSFHNPLLRESSLTGEIQGVYYPPNGRGVRELLHESNHGDSITRVFIAR
jgi:splicing factor 3B subunit 1